MKEGKWTWINEKFVLSETPQLHVFIQGLQYGYGGFEGIQCYPTDKGPAIFRLNDHLKRLKHTSEILGLNLPYSDQQIAEKIKETIKKNKFTACYIRPYVGATERKIGLVVEGEKNILAISVAADWAYFGKPVKAVISEYIRPHPKSFPMEAKCSGTYINSIIAKKAAIKLGYDEAILLDHEGYVAEASAANIFVVTKDKRIITPEKGSILPGITRDTVMQLASVSATGVTIVDLKNAGEIFVCGTAAEITPVVAVDFREVKSRFRAMEYWPATEWPIGNGKPGPITKKLQKLYKKAVTGKLPGYGHWLTYI